MVEARQRSPRRHGPSAGATHASYNIGERRIVHCSPSGLLKLDTAADLDQRWKSWCLESRLAPGG